MELTDEFIKVQNYLMQVKEQSEFCSQLMNKLGDSISMATIEKGYTSTYYDYKFAVPHACERGNSVVNDDIRRLRRELLILSKMLDRENRP